MGAPVQRQRRVVQVHAVRPYDQERDLDRAARPEDELRRRHQHRPQERQGPRVRGPKRRPQQGRLLRPALVHVHLRAHHVRSHAEGYVGRRRPEQRDQDVQRLHVVLRREPHRRALRHDVHRRSLHRRATCRPSPPVRRPASTAIPDPACAAGDIANPYWNASPQGLFDPNGSYPLYNTYSGSTFASGSNQSYIPPHILTFIGNWKHGRLNITPTAQFQGGAQYGIPLGTQGIDPVKTCAALPGATATTANDPRYPGTRDRRAAVRRVVVRRLDPDPQHVHPPVRPVRRVHRTEQVEHQPLDVVRPLQERDGPARLRQHRVVVLRRQQRPVEGERRGGLRLRPHAPTSATSTTRAT